MANKSVPLPTDYQQTGPLGTFTPSGAFNPTPEAQRVLDYLQARFNKRINVIPIPNAGEGLGGYFKHSDPEGGSSDPTTRNVYVNPKVADLSVLTHELGHAFDPNLYSREYAEFSSTPAKIKRLIKSGDIQNPRAFLDAYMTGPETRFKGEVEAQRASAQTLKDIGYPSTNLQEHPSFKGYPMSFVDFGLDQAAALYSIPRNVPDIYQPKLTGDRVSNLMSLGQYPATVRSLRQGDGFTELDLRDSFTQNMLNLALDEKYRKLEDLYKTRAIDYIESKLN